MFINKSELKILPISEAQVGGIIYTKDLVDNWYAFVVKRIEKTSVDYCLREGRGKLNDN